MSISRRDFIGASAAAAAAGLALPRIAAAEPVISSIVERSDASRGKPASRPVIISAGNGFTTDANGKQGIKVAYDLMTGGADPLDAIVEGVSIVELNPRDQSVGLGGLPNADGVVQLDASCMHGPSKRAGAVGCLEDVATAAAVAKAVMDYTDHIFLVGPGARRFAVEMGFKTQNLLTEDSRRAYMRWKADLNPDDNWLNLPPRRSGGGGEREDDEQLSMHVFYDEHGVPHTYGTINMNAVTASGDIASVTTTSGLSWKIPGRVGDSPIIGAGQYCDNEVGAAGSTGRGEANMKVCGAFLAVEFMRQGLSPQDAVMKVMERVVAMTEPRLLDEHGRPYFDLEYYAVNKKGEYAAANAYQSADPDRPAMFAVCDEKGPRMEPFAYLYTADQRPKGHAMSGTLVIPR
ncbi:MAG TPA: N(4)-(beta-N-acetylglucosaminyl)-L-asparaginase [Gemmatimonadaceae bacterium]|nr:N(4)-(beta-N-acetylglucosaminyl)-L-asparaginase [Gemmatimonadaceae bacterium]